MAVVRNKKTPAFAGVFLLSSFLTGAYYVSIPPFTLSTCPVTYVERGRFRGKGMRLLCLLPCRRVSGVWLPSIPSTTLGSSAPVISVSMKPGAMALQRMPREPSSKATDLVKPIIPASMRRSWPARRYPFIPELMNGKNVTVRYFARCCVAKARGHRCM